jgi:hypothetical protein
MADSSDSSMMETDDEGYMDEDYYSSEDAMVPPEDGFSDDDDVSDGDVGDHDFMWFNERLNP